MGSYAGVDWAAEKHDVFVAGEAGEELLSATFAHDENGLRALCGQLVRLEVELVAIERPDGLLVERLLDAGLRVLPLHPNQVAATRARFRVSGGKSDRFDAFVLCELARTDSHRFRVLEPDTDETKALRALTRAREDLVGTKVAVGNQLRAELERSGPPRSACSPIWTATSRWRSWSATRARRTHAGWARSACRRSSPASTTADVRSPRSYLAKLRLAPQGRVGEARDERSPTARALPRLDAQDAQHPDQHARAPDRHRGARPSRRRRLPVAVRKTPTAFITAAQMLAEIGDCRARYPTRDALAGDAGQAAVAIESGKRKAACFRWGCNKRLRSSFHTLADSTRHWHPWAADLYAAARDRGHDHPRALRTLGRAWCRIIWRCWQDRTPYNPARHRALQKHCTVTVPTSSGPRPDLAATQRMLGATVTPNGRPRSA